MPWRSTVLWLRCLSRRHGYLIPLSWRMVPGSLFDTRQTLSSSPGPDGSKQLAARDGYLSAVSQLKSVPAHAGRRCIPLSLGMSPPLSLLYCSTSKWLVICVSRVTCDFVSRLGGWDTNFVFKGRLIEPVLGGPHFCFVAEVLKSSTWIPCPSVLAHGTRLWFDTRRSLSSGPGPDASNQLAVRDGY